MWKEIISPHREGHFNGYKKKWSRILIPIITVSLVLLMPPLVPEAKAETRVTITVAAGGVACGAYFFLFMHTLTISYSNEH